jgi:hypothetical protein
MSPLAFNHDPGREQTCDRLRVLASRKKAFSRLWRSSVDNIASAAEEQPKASKKGKKKLLRLNLRQDNMATQAITLREKFVKSQPALQRSWGSKTSGPCPSVHKLNVICSVHSGKKDYPTLFEPGAHHGQKPVSPKKSISNFKIREGLAVGDGAVRQMNV